MSDIRKETRGGPIYTEELGDEICLKLSTYPRGIFKLCKENPHWPCAQTIFEWRIKIPTFGDKYAKAKQNQVEVLVDECMDIADDSGFDACINNEGKVVCDSEAINRARLRVDTRKWLAAQLAPKIYGNKNQEVDNEAVLNKANEALAKMQELADKCLKTQNQS